MYLAILISRKCRNVAFYSDIYYITGSCVRYFKTSTGKLGMLNGQITSFFSVKKILKVLHIHAYSPLTPQLISDSKDSFPSPKLWAFNPASFKIILILNANTNDCLDTGGDSAI